MPQMSPMNWLILFIYFNISLYLSMVKLYYMGTINMKSSNMEFKLSKNEFPFTI